MIWDRIVIIIIIEHYDIDGQVTMDIAVGSASGGPLAQGAEECRCPPGQPHAHAHAHDDNYPNIDS